MDYIESASEIGFLINQIIESPVNAPKEVPEEIALENQLDIRDGDDIKLIDQLETQVL